VNSRFVGSGRVYRDLVTERGSERQPVTPEEVLERVAAAGGHLVLNDLDVDELAEWRHAARVAQLRLWRTGSARLRRWTQGTTLGISVIDPSAPPKPPRTKGSATRKRPDVEVSGGRQDFTGRTVRVPSRLPVDPDPLVVEMKEGMERRDADRWRPYGQRAFVREWIPDVPRQKSGRMLRIWQGIVDEATFRGYRVRVGGDRGTHVAIVAGRDEFAATSGGTQHGLWLRLRPDPAPYEHGAPRSRDVHWSDSPEQPLELQLGSLFDRLEKMIQAVVEWREEEARQAAERRRCWKIAMAEARAQFAEQHRRDTLQQRIDMAAEVDHIHAYCAALRAAAKHADPSRREDILAWAGWAATYADEVDPIPTRAGMPAQPTPQPDDLSPYLHGWSPWGPG
jgi:hypothetical protein